MLQYCAAVMCVSSAQAEEFLRDLADQAGFSRVSSYEANWPRTPIPFFLVHEGVAEQEKRNIMAAVRGNAAFRFSPVLVIGQEGRPGPVSATEYRQTGFDDVIAAGSDIASVKVVLKSCVTDEQTYYSTLTYFGPDRRRWERQSTRPLLGRQDTAPYELYRFHRDPLAGIRVREHLVLGPTDVPPASPAGTRFPAHPRA